jgi:hypothetical protein
VFPDAFMEASMLLRCCAPSTRFAVQSTNKSTIRRFRLWGIFVSLAVAAGAQGQIWEEDANGGSDAGALPSGQITVGNGALSTIGGTITNPDTDVDMYCIRIADPATFSATVSETNQSRSPQLWLFDAAGVGVAHATDASAPYNVVMNGSLVPGPGIYFIAISRRGASPSDAGGVAIFPPIANGQTGPDPSAGPVTMWGSGSGLPGPYAIALTGTLHHQAGFGGDGTPGGPCWTYTSGLDFSQGYLFNLNVTIDPVSGDECLELSERTRTWPFMGAANSARGTLVRVATRNLPAYGLQEGDVVGEYFTAPNGMGRDPSRTTVDGDGNIWVTNRAEGSFLNGQAKGSVTRIGLVVGGSRVDSSGNPNPVGSYLAGPFAYCGCEDRDGDGLIKTSLGYNHTTGLLNADYTNTTLPWTNSGSLDTDGGVDTAEDECITAYVRIAGTYARHLSLARNGDLWTGGLGNRVFERVDTATVTPDVTSDFNSLCGGYGGLMSCRDVIWSARWGEQLMRYDVTTNNLQCLNIRSYGTAIDPLTGNIWTTAVYLDNIIREVSPAGVQLNAYNHSCVGPIVWARGLVVANSTVWVGHSQANTVGRVSTAGALCGCVDLNINPVGAAGFGPYGVAEDADNKIWTINNGTHNAMRIDPSLGTCGRVDLVVDLGSGSFPYNYSDFTGGQLMSATAPQGSWTVIHDGGMLGCPWGTLSWTAMQDPGTNIIVQVRASDSPTPSGPWTVVTNNIPFTGVMGRYLQVKITLQRPAPTCGPFARVKICDLTICKEASCDVVIDRIRCTTETPQGLIIAGTVTNNTGVNVSSILITPVPPSPVTFVPNIINVSIPNGGSAAFTTQAFGWTNNQPFCFIVTLLDDSHEACCSKRVCVTPDCDCLQVLPNDRIVCDPATGTYTYTFQFQNLTSDTIFYSYFFPPTGVTFTPNFVSFSPPIPPGGVSTPITVVIAGAQPGTTLCFGVTIHEEHVMECCARELCIQIPKCLKDTGHPNRDIHLTAVVADCAVQPFTTLTIFNSGTETRAFNWNVRPLGLSADCDFALPETAINPRSGMTPALAPGEFVDININITPGVVPDNMTACIEAVAIEPGTSFAVGARAQVRGRPCGTDPAHPFCPCVTPAPGTPGVVDIGAGTIPVSFDIRNTGAEAAGFQWIFLSAGPFVSINGMAPGNAPSGAVTLQPGQSTRITVSAAFVEPAPGSVQDLVLAIRPVNEYPGGHQPATAVGLRSISAATCRGDVNNDGVLNSQDFFDFLTAFFSGEKLADFNDDGSINSQDFFDFLASFFSGCP